ILHGPDGLAAHPIEHTQSAIDSHFPHERSSEARENLRDVEPAGVPLKLDSKIVLFRWDNVELNPRMAARLSVRIRNIFDAESSISKRPFAANRILLAQRLCNQVERIFPMIFQHDALGV